MPLNAIFPATAVILPIIAASALALVASWRIGIWINAAAASLLFLMTCLAWQQAAMPIAFVAMTTSWFGLRDVPALLEDRTLSPQRVRLYHAAFQVLVGAILLAVTADDIIIVWAASAIAVGAAATVIGAAQNEAAAGAASRLVRLCGAGLMIALLGTLLLDQAPLLAGSFLLIGYGAIAGLVPLHAWLTGAAAEGVAPGAIIVTAALPNVPLLLFMRLPIEPDLLIAAGLISLLLAAVALLVHEGVRRSVALAGMGQIGTIVFAIGIGAPHIAWLLMVLLTLARVAVLQSAGGDLAAWLGLSLLPLYALCRLSGPVVVFAPWLLLPFAAGTALLEFTLLQYRRPTSPAGWLAVAPIWLQVGLVVALAFAVSPP